MIQKVKSFNKVYSNLFYHSSCFIILWNKRAFHLLIQNIMKYNFLQTFFHLFLWLSIYFLKKNIFGFKARVNPFKKKSFPLNCMQIPHDINLLKFTFSLLILIVLKLWHEKKKLWNKFLKLLKDKTLLCS